MTQDIIREETCACAPTMRHGRISGRNGAQLIVLDQEGACTAEKAASCLLQPEIGDLVLYYRPEQDRGQAYVLAVLQRQASEEPARFDLAPDVGLEAGDGEVRLLAKGIDLGAAERMTVRAKELDCGAETGTLRFGACTLFSGLATVQAGTLRALARVLDSTAERITVKADRRYTEINDFEESVIGRLRQRIQGAFSLRAKQASVKAEKQVKVDGDKILLG